MPLAVLPDRGVIGVGGEDARSFLDGLITSSVAGLESGAARYGALLTPQGKIIVDFIVTADPGGLLLDVPRALAAELARKLGFYKLRARVTVEDLSASLGVAAAWDTPVPDLGTAYADPRLPALGHRIIGERDALTAAADASADDYAARRIGLGVPAGGVDFVYGDTFPHEADMDLLGGVDTGVSFSGPRPFGQGRVTDNLADALPLLDGALFVDDARTIAMVYRLLKDEGIFAGPSSALNVVAAGDLARRLGPGKTVVTVICDGAHRYQGRLFSRKWLESKGLLAHVPDDCTHLVTLP